MRCYLCVISNVLFCPLPVCSIDAFSPYKSNLNNQYQVFPVNWSLLFYLIFYMWSYFTFYKRIDILSAFNLLFFWFSALVWHFISAETANPNHTCSISSQTAVYIWLVFNRINLYDATRSLFYLRYTSLWHVFQSWITPMIDAI